MSVVLRHFLIALSKNPWMQDLIVDVPLTRRMARRYVAGETLAEAIHVIRATNDAGMTATVDFLGENVTKESEARANADEYIRILQAIHDEGLDANISIKPTAMGLAMDDQLCRDNVRLLVQWAAELGNFVRVDMEDSAVTERTLGLYRHLRGQHDNVGTVIQSYLYRSQDDVRDLLQSGLALLRLCKGAYDEPSTVAFRDRVEIDRELVALIKLMLDGLDRYPGTYPAVASHDQRIINWTKAYAYHHQVAVDRFEFQMLHGIRSDLQRALTAQGYHMRVYIPYGTAWYPYFMRRLAERPANLLLFLRSLVGN
jgi:proline dehydrogenase